MKVEQLVDMLLEASADGHALFPTEMLRITSAELDVDTMANLAENSLVHQIQALKPGSKKFAQKDEMAKMLYHLRDDAEFRAEVARVMLREYRKEFADLVADVALDID